MLTFIAAITAGFVVYNFMFSLSERMKVAFPVGSLQLESTFINSTCLTVYVRNFASVNIRIVEAYINDNLHSLKESVIVLPSTVGVIHLYSSYRSGETYSVKIIPSLGSPLIFNIKYE